MDKPFSFPVYQQAKRLYQQSKIKNFKANNNIVDATVLDGGSNQVKLVFNMSGQCTSKRCDCSYSKFYHECKHMAAVYMKVKDENVLSQGPIKLRELYDTYIGSKARPLEKNYSDFEFKVKQSLNKFRLNNQIENIFSYCFEFSNIIYPAQRKEFIVSYIQEILNDLLKNHYPKIEEWMTQCLIDDKNDYLHDYFLDVIKSNNLDILNDLIENEKIHINNALLTKILLVIYENSHMTIEEFVNQYFFVNNEVMHYLCTKELFNQGQFSKVINAYHDFNLKYPYSTLKSEMVHIYEKSLLGNDPTKYVDKYIDKLNYWTKDLSNISSIKRIVGEEWMNIRYETYKKIETKIQKDVFVNLIHEQNEWEVALGFIYENPNYNNISAYLDLIMKNDESSGCAAYFEYIVNSLLGNYRYNMGYYLKELLNYFYRNYKNKDAMDHMIYYLRLLFKEYEDVLQTLDEMEVYYEG